MKIPGVANYKTLAVVAAAFILGAALLYFSAEDEEKDAAGDALNYINGVKKRDFDTTFDYHGPSQRRRAIILKNAGTDAETRLKELYEEQKNSFEESVPAADLRAEWAEKFLFIPGGNFTLKEARVVEDTDNPSQPVRERIYVIISVEANYLKVEDSPDLNGKVKSIIYEIKMVHSKNIARTLRGDIRDRRWLFQGVSFRNGSIRYWR